MKWRVMIELYQFCWLLEQQGQQRMAWDDAADARIARARAEARAEAQLRAMLAANPSGQLGNAQLNDPRRLRESGLL